MAKTELANAKNSSEKEFLEAVCHGMTVLRKMTEKFAAKAEQMLATETEAEISVSFMRSR
jgi:hypothetical protein